MRPIVLLLLLLAAPLARAEEAPAPVLTKPPKLVEFVEADYPPARREAGETASVTLTLDIAADGRVAAVAVVQSAGADFDAAAVAAARRFVFEPGEVDGRPAPVRVTYRYDFVLKPEVVPLGPQVTFDGTVVERFSKRPLQGVTVALPALGVSAVTDAGGHFELVGVPPGEHRVELRGERLVTVGTVETIAAGERRTVRYLVEERAEDVDEEEVVRAPRLRKESVVTALRTEEARRVPGTQGDTLKVVQNLPGVARAQAGSGQVIIWGAAPRESRVYVDGVEIPALYHIGGLRSTLSSGLVKSVELIPGAFGAEYGRALGGLVRVETRPLPHEGVHGHAQVDLLDASAMLAVAKGRFRIAAAGRYGWLDRILAGVIAPDVGEFFPLTRYHDYQLKASVDLRKHEELALTFLGSDDHLLRVQPSPDPAATRRDHTDAAFHRVALRWSRLFDDGSSATVTPFFGVDRSLRELAFGRAPSRLAQTAWVYGLRAGWRGRVHRLITLALGLDWLGARTELSRTGSLTLPPREGDVTVFGQPPGADVAQDTWSTHLSNLGPHVAVELRAGPVTITPGLRLDLHLIEASHLSPQLPDQPPVGTSRLEWALDPRLAIAWRAHRRLALTLSGGLYHQAPDPEDLSAVFGNPRLGLSRAAHVALGARVAVTATLSVETTGFYKYLDQLVMRTAAATPPIAGVLEQSGSGHSYGAQLLIRQELFKNFFGWVTYTVSRSERQNRPGAPTRLFDFDQTHVLAVVASYTYRGWGFGVRLRYATGFPRTPVVGAYYDGAQARFDPIFGAQNTIRIPDFVQLDVRLEKSFRLPRGVTFDVYLDVQNVTWQRNPEEIVYSHDYSQRGYITGIPTLAVLGLRVAF